jgi:hypothetical protein
MSSRRRSPWAPWPAGAAVPVPEAAMDEDHGPASGHDQVRPARQRLALQPVPIARAPQQPAHGQLGAGVPAPDLTHHLRAFLGGERRPSQTLEQGRRQVALGEARITTTTVLPAISGRAATWKAAIRAAPEEIPTGRPSTRAARRAMSKDASLETVITSSMTPRSRDARHEAGPDALDLVRPGIAARQHGRGLRLHRHHAQGRLAAFSTWPTPGDRPARARRPRR